MFFLKGPSVGFNVRGMNLLRGEQESSRLKRRDFLDLAYKHHGIIISASIGESLGTSVGEKAWDLEKGSFGTKLLRARPNTRLAHV